MQRLDKIISSQTSLSRNDVKKLIKKCLIKVNGKIVDKGNIQVDELNDIITIGEEELHYKKYVYLVLNKPKGYVSATTDESEKTVIDLCPDEFLNRNLFPVGRLDKDTTGLMIISDDGDFAHNILSPKKHVSKKYYVELSGDLSTTMVDDFKNGIKLIDGECKSSTLEIIDKRKCYVTLTEGRYHQIKRMFGCYGLEVLELKRIKIGNLELPKELEEGSCRELTQEELNSITEKGNIA